MFGFTTVFLRIINRLLTSRLTQKSNVIKEPPYVQIILTIEMMTCLLGSTRENLWKEDEKISRDIQYILVTIIHNGL